MNESTAAELEQVLGYRFHDRDLLRQAVTHSSSQDPDASDNERLEFLGDAILGAIVSIYLHVQFPEFQEGRMTKVKSAVVSRRNLALKGRELELQRFVIVGRMFADENAITDSILSNAFEALIAAVFLDGGMDEAQAFILRHLEQCIHNESVVPGQRDHKSALGQWAQRNRLKNPAYVLVSAAGPDHLRTFEMTARIGSRRFPPAWGRSKKECEQRAARAAMQELGAL